VPEVPADPDLRLTLLDALATLPELDRAIIVLRYWEDCSIELTARLVGVSPAAVKTRSRRALAVLRGRLAPR
jgi:RNA polymerase sigma factor (sigma-70 family)